MCLAEPPRVEAASHPTEISIAVGTPLELACVVTGVPTPSVTWEKDGRLLAGPSLVLGNESTLHIESTEVGAPLFFPPYLGFLFVPQFLLLLALQVADAGLYTCLATSPAGEDSRSFHVSTQGSVTPAVQRGGAAGCPKLWGTKSQSIPASSFGVAVGSERGVWSTVMVLQSGAGMGVSNMAHPDPPQPFSHSTSQHSERQGDPRHHGCGRGAAPPGVPRGC